MLVGEVRCASIGPGCSWKLSGGSQLSSAARSARSSPSSCARCAAGTGAPSSSSSAISVGGTGGSAGRRSRAPQPTAAGRAAPPRSCPDAARAPAAPTTSAATGLATISTKRVRTPRSPRRPEANEATEAAVSHSSRRLRVSTRRTSVSTIAWTISLGVVGQEGQADERLGQVGAERLEARADEHAERLLAAALEHAEQREQGGERQHRERRRAPGPGRLGEERERAANHARYAGASRLRRRLSKILKRLISGSRLRSKPVRVRTQGSSQPRICQSPRTQRCRRRACARTLAG